MRLVTSIALLLSFPLLVQAAPNGAPNCIAGGASVNGAHLSYDPNTTPSFAEHGYEFVLNAGTDLETVLSDPSMTFGLVRGTYTMSVRAVGGRTFRGALIRISNNEIGVFQPTENAKSADLLCGTPAITHMENSDKKIFSGEIELMAEGIADIDITIVEYNNFNQGSSYSYEKFTISVMAPQSTSAPAAGPVECDPLNPFCSIADIILQLINLIALIFGGGGDGAET